MHDDIGIVAVTGIETVFLNNRRIIKNMKKAVYKLMYSASEKGNIFATANSSVTSVDFFARSLGHAGNMVVLNANYDFLNSLKVGIIVRTGEPHLQLDRLQGNLNIYYLFNILENRGNWFKNKND